VDELSADEEDEEPSEVVEVAKPAPKALNVAPKASKPAAAVPVTAKQEPVAKPAPAKGDADSSSDEEDDVAQEKKAKAVKNQKLKKELKKEQEELGKILMTKRQRQILEQAEQSNKTKMDQS
jgi:hypothetical protein